MFSMFNFWFCFIYFVWVMLFFFFSSRRRHTRCSRDWSSRRVLFRSRQRSLTSGRVVYPPSAVTQEQYEWRATVREFDEVDAPGSVTTSVSLVAQLVRVAEIGRASCRERV